MFSNPNYYPNSRTLHFIVSSASTEKSIEKVLKSRNVSTGSPPLTQFLGLGKTWVFCQLMLREIVLTEPALTEPALTELESNYRGNFICNDYWISML